MRASPTEAYNAISEIVRIAVLVVLLKEILRNSDVAFWRNIASIPIKKVSRVYVSHNIQSLPPK